jgi:chemotaxis protein MotA
VIPATFLGMGLAVGSLVVMMLLEGSSPLAVVLLPPLVLVFGATFGAAIAGSTLRDVRQLGRWFAMAFGGERLSQTPALIAQLVELATVARKEGMLPLENRARAVTDPFLRHGLQMAVDGVPVEQLRRVLEGEIEAHRADDRVAVRFFARMGGYAPTIGIIGTVVGLVQVLRSLEDPSVLGPLVATAFVATLWGVLSANFLWLPIGGRLGKLTDLESEQMTILIEGVMALQAGSQPRLLGERLLALVPEHQQGRGKQPKPEKEPEEEAA